MSKNKGFTLIETLFAFQIYLCIIYLLISLSQNINLQYNHLTNSYRTIWQKEALLLEEGDIIDLIEKVLH